MQRLVYAVIALLATLAVIAPSATAAMRGIPSPRAIVIHSGCPGDPEASCADQAQGIVYLANNDRFTRQHELGHLADAQMLDDAERDILKPFLRVPRSAAWENGTDTDCLTRACPNERFADAYAACRLGLVPHGQRRGRVTVDNWVDSYGYEPRSNTAHTWTCAVIGSYLR